MELLAWYNLIFEIPLAVGLLLVLGVALGASDLHHPHFDADGHAGGDHDAEEQGGVLQLLGFGRVPVVVIFMVMLLTFGGAGTSLNFFLPPALVALSIVGAFVVMFVSTRFVGRLVSKYMPTIETKTTQKTDLVGCTGVLLFSCDSSSGLAQIVRDGDVFQISCCSTVPLAKGAAILVTDYDEATDRYFVCRDPVPLNER